MIETVYTSCDDVAVRFFLFQVHNQRIERLWRDVMSGVIGSFYEQFNSLEEQGHLDIDDMEQLLVLQVGCQSFSII